MSVDHDSIKANDLLVEGKRLYDAGKHEEAVASFDKAIEIKPEFVDVWNSKGDALLSLKKYEEAIASYDKAIEIDTKNALAWRKKAFALRKLERYDDAMVCYDKAIQIDPKNAVAWKGIRKTLKKLGSPEYDPRCAGCDHYPWTHVFVSGRGYDDREPRWIWNNKFTGIHGCKCGCHDPPTYGKIMRFSLKRKDGKSKHVMHVKKLAVCPFCKRSEFEDSVFDKINDRDTSSGLRHEMLAEDLKATGAPERDSYDFDYNDLYESGRYESKETLLTPCTGNHKHEWYRCACGRKVCKISFRNYFGYEISDELFDNDFVDRSYYSERTKALLDEVKQGYGDKYPPFEPKSAEVPTYATMATIEKVWGKLPRYRSNQPWEHQYGNSYSDFPSPKWDREETRPSPWKIRDIPEMSEKILSPEDISNYFLEVKEERIQRLENSFVYDVSGMGTTTAEKLLEKFGTPYKVFSATEEEIAKITFGRKYNRNYSETRAKKIRKDLDDYTKECGSLEDIVNKKRKEAFTFQILKNPSYTYSSESFEENSS